jgi:SAM-dependent methyltransferase
MTVPALHRDQAGEVLRLFEAKAPGWAEKYAPDGPLAHRLVTLTVAVRWRAQAGSRVLDLGCGTGELARSLTASGLRVTGCDISPQMLRHARDRGGCAGWVRLAPGWGRLPFASGAFDVVVAASVLEYVDDPAAVLRECARVLRYGGLKLYTVPNLRHPVRWAEWFAQRLATLTGERAWRRYRAYLRTSRQRHRVRWWRAVSASAGLSPAPCPGRAGRSTLRLLAFHRDGRPGTRQGSRA